MDVISIFECDRQKNNGNMNYCITCLNNKTCSTLAAQTDSDTVHSRFQSVRLNMSSNTTVRAIPTRIKYTTSDETM